MLVQPLTRPGWGTAFPHSPSPGRQAAGRPKALVLIRTWPLKSGWLLKAPHILFIYLKSCKPEVVKEGLEFQLHSTSSYVFNLCCLQPPALCTTAMRGEIIPPTRVVWYQRKALPRARGSLPCPQRGLQDHLSGKPRVPSSCCGLPGNGTVRIFCEPCWGLRAGLESKFSNN